MNWKAILFGILISLLQKMTPELRRSLCTFLKDWQERCKTTPNPIDDVIADLLIELFGCKDE